MRSPPPFLTLFAIPKPFRGRTAVQQRNAIGSWMRLPADVEVLLCGDEEGTQEAARDLGASHVPEISRNDQGTPLVNAIFEVAAMRARAPLVGYVNADIVLMSDFLRALGRLHLSRFLMCGQRWDVRLETHLEFDSPEWEIHLRALVQREGRLNGVEWIDYFVFPRGLIPTTPPFAVGRTVWDNWLLFHARALRVPLVDATQSVMAVHQHHDYAHTGGTIETVWQGAEAKRNRELASEMLYPFTIQDATVDLTPQGLRYRSRPHDMVRRLQSSAALALRRRPFLRQLVRNVLRAKSN
jgi:hypothetical protein